MRWLISMAALLIPACAAQQSAPPPERATASQNAGPNRPLPELHALMLAVLSRQKEAETAARDYIYRESFHIDKLGKNDEVKQTELWEQDVFYVDGVEIHKRVSRDGKPLSPDEQKKEDARVDKEIEKGRQKRARQEAKDGGEDPDLAGEVRLSRMLAAGSFSNERREPRNGRDVILVDFVGDPKAKIRSPMHEMKGTIGIDEENDAVTEMHGEFFNDWKLLGGMIAKIDRGTQFSLQNVRVNDEVWLPAQFELQGEARVLLVVSGHVRVQITDRDYRKFKATSTIVPGFRPVDPEKP